MAIGRMQHRITLQRKTRASDGAGGSTVTWADLGDRWAEVKPVRGREGLDAGITQMRQTYLVIVRKDSVTEAVTAADRVIFDSDNYNILTVRRGIPNGMEQRAYMTFEVETEIGEV